MSVRSYNGREVATDINREFTNIPTTNIPTTVSNRFIDGTAGGSLTDVGYRWNVFTSGSASYYFDTTTFKNTTGSLKLSTLAAASYLEAFLSKADGSLGGYFGKTRIPVIGGRTYRYSFWMKTNYVSGDSGSGAHISLLGSDSNGNSTSNTSTSTIIKTTTDWTLYTGTYIAKPNTAYVQINPRVYGHTGAATLIMNAWFDDISFTEVLPARATSSTRTPAVNRVKVKDMGTALRFGATNSVAITNSFFDTNLTSSVTVSAWVYFNDISNRFVIVKRDGSGGNFRCFSLEVSNVGKDMQFNVKNTSDVVIAATATGGTIKNKWFHVVGRYDGATVSIWINGIKKQQNNQTGTIKLSVNSFRVGSLDGSQVFNGIIDEPTVWGRGLSDAEIVNLALNNIVPPDALGRYLFDEASGTTAIDSSGNGNNGTITGATYTTDVPLELRDTV